MSARPLPIRRPHARPSSVGRARPGAVRRQGFSFVEILFAIGVLGIGFIMLAAIFPVGLQQTKLTLDETTSAANSRSMAARLQQLASSQVQFGAGATDLRAVFPGTYVITAAPAVVGQRYNGQVRTLNDPRAFTDGMTGTNANTRQFNMWAAAANELIQPSDPRSATAVMFKRDSIGAPGPVAPATVYQPAPTAQVIVINAQVANQPEYKTDDVYYQLGTPLPKEPKMSIYNLEPRPVGVQIVKDTDNDVYIATFFSVTTLNGRGGYPPAGNGPNNQPWDDVLNEVPNAVEEGCFIVISDDRIDGPANSSNVGRLNGRVYRLGARRTDLANNTFELAPGYSFTPDPGADGFFNSTARASSDDILAIGVGGGDVAGNDLANGKYGYMKQPNGAGGPNATNTTVVGSPADYGAVALVLGRGFADPTGLTPVTMGNTYTGPIQDVSAYTTFISVSNP
ncbi:MAG TPA: hypothetical protein VF595_06100 [Tepidisphaeraceae bacterium]